jgi:preprotein translocase subunit SecF
MRIFENASYPFMDWRRRAYLVTAVLLLVGIGSMVMNWQRHGSWLNYGVDFLGGTLVQLELHGAHQRGADPLRRRSPRGTRDWAITRFGGANEFVVRTASFEESLETPIQQQVQQTLAPTFGEAFSIERVEAVGPKVGSELQLRALIAILLSFLATMLYLWIRFEWRFGVAAVVATAHDILVTLGFLAFMHSEISLGTVAAFLTIVGYSLNDTIVVFDRIRENLAKPRHGRSMAEILNLSINETLPRTVLTGVSTLATLGSLAILGGPVIRDFAVVLILGIIIGTFSSIFVAAPVLHAMEARFPRAPQKPAGRPLPLAPAGGAVGGLNGTPVALSAERRRPVRRTPAAEIPRAAIGATFHPAFALSHFALPPPP